MIRQFHDIKHVLYINLDARIDRRNHFEMEFNKMGLQTQRFPAIKKSNGAVGCSMSHIACLELAIQNKWDHVLICEDDATITNPGQLVYQVNQFFKNFGEHWDVLLLAGNNYQPFRQMSPECVRVGNCQTATCYLANSHYFETLLNNFKKGLRELETTNDQPKYAIDQYWKQLQRLHRWYLIVPISVIQRSDYSNICNQHVDYRKDMLAVNKKWYGS